jgi:threonine/homoserine/homoserine lactone efflux protein
MLFFTYFFAAFFLSLLGSLPFGVINLNILSTAVHSGKKSALQMTFGAVMIEGIQLIFILMSYRYLAANPAFDRVLHYLALPVFLGLAGYYLLAKSNIKTEVVHPKYPFIQGVIFALMNVLVYPFWLFWLAWLEFPVDQTAMQITFIAGAVSGAFISMLLFIFLGQLIKSRTRQLTTYLNKIIGCIFLGLALWEMSKYLF